MTPRTTIHETIDGDRADYRAGALLLKAEVHIRRARCVLGRLESMGRDDLMKIQKQVDWAALADKPDAFLAALGTGREIREKIGYDLKAGHIGGADKMVGGQGAA